MWLCYQNRFTIIPGRHAQTNGEDRIYKDILMDPLACVVPYRPWSWDNTEYSGIITRLPL